MRDLHLDHLRAFVEVIERGSFSAAARRLNLTQPAISQQVRSLERRLGVRLIERLGRRATPTLAGEELLAHCRTIDAAVGAAVAAMDRHATGTVGQVRLGTGATACTYLLPPVLRRLRAAFPSLQIVVVTGNTPDLARAVEENRIDVGLLTLPTPGRIFDVTPLLDDPFVAFTAADDAADLPDTVDAHWLARRPVVLYEPGAHTRRLVDLWSAQAGVSIAAVMELGNVEAIKQLVGAGLGCGVLPGMAVPAGERGLAVRPLDPPLSRQLGLVLRRDKVLHRGLREVVEALKALAPAMG